MTCCAASRPDPASDGLAASAARLLGRPVLHVAAAGHGGNNRLYRVETADGVYALKLYPDEPRDRLGAEFAFLSFLGRHGVDCVPAALACDRTARLGLYGWLDGTPPTEILRGHIDQLLAFAAHLDRLRHEEDARGLPLASETCLSGEELIAQIERRLARLLSVEDAELHAFLRDEVAPALKMLAAPARAWAELALPERTLSPSDFGFHNALERDGRLRFLDFEYAGWDDPVKLIADVRLHPAMNLKPELRARFLNGALALYSDRPGLRDRLAAFEPLYALRWTMILLNEFLPERWARRAWAAGADPVAEQATAQARQLAKARSMFQRSQSNEV